MAAEMFGLGNLVLQNLWVSTYMLIYIQLQTGNKYVQYSIWLTCANDSSVRYVVTSVLLSDYPSITSQQWALVAKATDTIEVNRSARRGKLEVVPTRGSLWRCGGGCEWGEEVWVRGGDGSV